MKMVFQQKVQEKESKLKQSEEELYARHREMKDALDKQRLELEDKKRRIESGRPITPEKGTVGTVSQTKLLLASTDSGRKNDSVSANRHLWPAAKSSIWSQISCLSVYPLRQI